MSGHLAWAEAQREMWKQVMAPMNQALDKAEARLSKRTSLPYRTTVELECGACGEYHEIAVLFGVEGSRNDPHPGADSLSLSGLDVVPCHDHCRCGHDLTNQINELEAEIDAKSRAFLDQHAAAWKQNAASRMND